MLLKDHIRKDLVFIGLKPGSKADLLKDLAEKTADRLPAVDPATLLQKLIDRENQVSTGIGQGVAVPHATLDSIDQPYCLMAQVPDGVDFAALDQTPVSFLFLLISPPGNVGVHIKLLARISRLAKNAYFIQDLVGMQSARQVIDRVVQEDSRRVN